MTETDSQREPCQQGSDFSKQHTLMQAVVRHLMQQYAVAGTAYLNLAKLKRVPDSLRNPGPNPSLAGDLQTVEDMSAQGQAQIYFTLKPGRAQQLMHFDAARGKYERLQQPW